MVSEAYERNFRGMATAIEEAHRKAEDVQKQIHELMRQQQDVLLRINQMEAQILNLLARTATRGSQG